jgi:glycosyltransferase involved in cell wall biosynthesis
VTRAPTPPERARRRTQPTLLYAGRLLPFKGVSLALRALELLPEWRFVICGSGPDEGRLRRLALRANLQHRIEFRGWVDHEELARVMREEVDVFVFPSLHDQAPLVVAEATTAGLPVVCLDRGGAKLLGGRGIRVGSPRETAEALAEAIRQAGDLGPGRFRDRSEQTIRLREIVLRRTHKELDGDR